MISLSNVQKSYGDKIIFKDLSLTIYDCEKIGIIGDNGQGKTTLLKIIMGETDVEYGTVYVNESIGYLKQVSEFNVNEILNKLENQDFSKSFFMHLKKMGMKHFNLDNTSLTNLSCGEKTKLALAFAFAQNPTALILDEPTNHLDMEAKKVLIDQINAFPGTVLVVSHDTYFLNNTIFKILRIKDGVTQEFYGNYKDYEDQISNLIVSQQREYDAQNKKINKIENEIDKLRRWADKADKNVNRQGGSPSDSRLASLRGNAEAGARKISSAAKNKISALEKELEERLDAPEKEPIIRYRLKKDDIKSKIAISVQDVSKSFGENVLFQGVNFTIESGEKVALIGRNGCGKTTLINMILGKEQPTAGVIRKTPSLKIGLMSQDIYDLPQEKTIFELATEQDKEYRTFFITNLVNMNIDKTRFNTKIKNLSLGEQMRIKLSELILSDANMLILDEPTNHLDISNKNYLKKVLENFAGTLLIVSHDQDFLQGIATTTLIFENQTVKKNMLICDQDNLLYFGK